MVQRDHDIEGRRVHSRSCDRRKNKWKNPRNKDHDYFQVCVYFMSKFAKHFTKEENVKVTTLAEAYKQPEACNMK